MLQASVLVVEDEYIVARDIRSRLMRQGYTVPAIVATGEEAVEAVDAHAPDLVLMDIMLKGDMDGIEAAERIRARTDTPVVFLTAYADETTLRRAKVTDAFGYLLKPFEERELHITIEMALTKHAMERRLRDHERFLATTLRNIADAVIVTGPGHAITYMNPEAERLTGWSHAEAAGMPVADVARVERARGELVARHGRRTPVEESMAQMADDHGTTIGSVYVFRDVTERRRAEEALRESMERYRNLYQNTPTMLHSLDHEGRLVNVSDYWLHAMGYTRDEVVRRRLSEFMTESSRLHFDLTVLPELLRTGRCMDVPLQIVRKGGRIMETLLSGVEEGKEEGGVPRINAVCIDITDRKRAEEQIRFQASLLAHVHNAVIATDLSRVITYWNTFAEVLYGWKSAEVLGKNLLDVIVPPAERKTMSSLLRATRESGEWEGEFLAIRRGGGTVPVAMTDAEIRDTAGRVVGFVTVSTDITERRRGEEALRQSEERYRLFFEDDLTGDYIATAGGVLESCNEAFARIFGFASVQEAQCANLFSLYPHDNGRAEFLRQLNHHKRLHYHEKDLIRRDGRQVHVVENVIGEFGPGGELLQFKGYMFDDTDRKRLEDQLRQAQKMDSIGTLASGIAHDFNNILNNVLGFSMQLQKHSTEPARVMKYSQTIERSASRGAELSAQLLSFARMSKREMVPLDVTRVVEEVTSLCRETFPRTIEVTRRCDSPLGHVLGDRGELYQVLLNLAVNARDAILQKEEGQTGRVTIEARSLLPRDDSSTALLPGGAVPCVELRVSDTGVGIPKSIRDRIFDPFFTTKERGRGTGLGLAVVYTVVRNHRGVLLVESEEGSGSVFRALLPSVEEQETPQPSAAVVRGSEEARGVVLIVDDEEPMQELGRELLEEQGYTVLIASSGAEAITLYRERSAEIDLVVLDLVMTGLDGSQTYLELKKINPHIRALFCTGYMPDQIVSALLEREHLECIQKPFNPDAFVTLVHDHMKRSVA